MLTCGVDDVQLLLAWRSGDADAGNELLTRYFDVLWRFFSTKAPAHAADLVQRTLMACVERRDAIADPRGFRAYLLRAAHNQAIDHYRREGARPSFDAEVDAIDTAALTPSSAVARKREHKLLVMGLRRLPLADQVVLELAYWEGLECAELGAVLGVSEEAAKKRLQRARERLRDLLSAVADATWIETTLLRPSRWAEELRAMSGDAPR